MRFARSPQLLEEIARFRLRSACRDCFFFVMAEQRCAHGWPSADQQRDPLEEDGAPAAIAFCKEFELR
jgi:hypothetical protein